jgi:hypothetical protein
MVFIPLTSLFKDPYIIKGTVLTDKIIFWMRVEQIWIRIDHPLSVPVFKIKMIILNDSTVDPKHKNSKGPLQIKETVK